MPRKRSRRITVEDVQYVHANYAAMTAAELASARKISLYQVNKIVADLRKAGVDLPEKKVKRTNPVAAYVETLGLERKTKRGPTRRKTKTGRKKTARK